MRGGGRWSDIRGHFGSSCQRPLYRFAERFALSIEKADAQAVLESTRDPRGIEKAGEEKLLLWLREEKITLPSHARPFHILGPMGPSRQFQSVIDTFGRQGWHSEPIEGREVIESSFEAHHTHIRLHAQVFTNLNALSIVAETPLKFDDLREPMALELVMRANKQLTIGNFEYDLDRSLVVFRATNIFERELYDGDIISSLVHCAIAELDRIVPLASVLNQTADDLLDDLSIPLLLEREDLLPPVPEYEGEEEEL